MKKISKYLILPLLLIMSFALKVNAAGSVPASFTSNATVEEGKTVSFNIYVGTVTGGADGKVYMFGGFVSYDPAYLEYQSISGSNGWSAQMNTSNKKIAIADYSLSNGVKNGTIGTIKFKALKTGSTTVTMTGATASDTSGDLGVTFTGKTISITDPVVIPPKSSNSKLASLEVEGYTLTPSFASSTTSYQTTVPYETESVKINATTEDSKATVTGTGSVSLTNKLTTKTVKVTAEDGTVTNYVVNIIKSDKKEDPKPIEPDPVVPKSSDSTLKKLDVSGYTLTPAFSSGVTSYAMKVNNNITSLNVTAIPNDEKAKVSITGNKNWVVGNNAIIIKVTAEDGTQTVYTVNVNRAAANVKSRDTNVDLRIISSHTINPEYSNSINDYNVVVPNEIEKLDLSVIPYDKKTKVEIIGNDNLEVNVLKNIVVKVKAEDGTIRNINLNVTRSEQKANTDLLDLRVVGHTLNPQFKPSITEYDVSIKYNEDELEIVTKTPEGATAEIIGNENLKVGKNSILVKVTDENGYIKYYEINATKADKKHKIFTIFGLTLIPFIILLGLLLLLLIIIILLLRNKDDKDENETEVKQQDAPVNIDIKPEFNFNSRNNSDNTDLYAEGSIISGSKTKKLPDNSSKEVYDIYDDVVTKDELVDAINESIETKNPEKLKMLLEQEKLNRKKEEIKSREERRSYDEDEEDYK